MFFFFSKPLKHLTDLTLLGVWGAKSYDHEKVWPYFYNSILSGRWIRTLHRKKSFSIFPSPAMMSLTKLTLGGNNDVIYKLFPPRESLVSDIPAGDGNIEKLFLGCILYRQQQLSALPSYN
jgi:hypothetical protein